MTVSSYAQARDQLNEVLRSTVFQPPPQRTPWWMLAWQWLGQHLHLALKPLPWHTVAVLAIALAACLLCVAAWWVVRRLTWRKGRVLTRARTRPRALSTWLERAAEAYHRRDYRQMLADLIDGCLRYAAEQRWWRYDTSETSRRYQALVQHVPNASFQAVFTELVTDAERVRYGGVQMDDATAQAWLARVKATVEEAPR